jgi:uncharacterized protein (TIGR02246 family)
MPTNPNSTITPNARLGAALADALEGQLPADECQQIATIPERYVEHALADDWASLAQLYHPDALQLMPDAPPVEGRAAIRAALARQLGSEGGARLTAFSVAIAEAELLGDTVYVRAHYRLAVAPPGASGTVRQEGPYVNLLCRDADGTWRIWRQFVGRAHPPAGPEME